MSDSWTWPGSRWWKFDFHAHTPESIDYGAKQITPKEWLLGFMRAGVDCVAVTDHNTGAWIDRLQDALLELKREKPPGFNELHLFPGVEITANGNIHILAVFDADKRSADITSLLGAVGFHGKRGTSEVAAESSPIAVVRAIVESDAIPILAHVDGPSGAWDLSGNTLGPLLDSDGLFTMQVIDSKAPKPEVYRQRKLDWAEVAGSDSHHPSGKSGPSYPGSHFTWVKMATPSLEGLRLALLDGGGFSIRRSDDPELFNPFATPEHFIEEVRIKNARYMGNGKPAILNFNPWLNALVGGRGTGKSTVIHSLRLAARRAWLSNGSEATNRAQATFDEFSRVPTDRSGLGGLRDQTEIRLKLMRDGVPHRILWRQDGGGTVVEERSESEGWKKSASQTVTRDRFPLRIFSQGQIADLAGENRQELLNVIDEAAGVDALVTKLDQARSAFCATRSKIQEISGRLERRDGLMVELEDVGRKLRRLEESGHAAILTAYRISDRQSREVDRQVEATKAAAQQIDKLAADLLPEDIPDGLFNEEAEEDKQALASMTAIADAMRESTNSLRDAAARLRDTTRTQRETLAQSSWLTAVTQASNDYKNLIASLQQDGVVDPSDYGRLVQDRQGLEGDLEHLEAESDERERLESWSLEQLKEAVEARRAVTDARDEFLRTALAQNNFVRIETRPYGGDGQAIERSLREALGIDNTPFRNDILSEDGSRGCVAQLLRNLPDDDVERREEFESRLENLKQRFKSACNGRGNFGGWFNNYLKRQFDGSPDFLDKLLTWFPEDGLVVEYSRSGDGKDFRPISQGSAGQRAAAMLAFLLAHGEDPLILDQPEDDLDNHLIYDLVVRQIRENKLRRQIIVVTHNPNIVVNGDAEMLHALDFHQEQCVVAQSGSLQDKEMREEICRVMEGGREAFDRRYRRLGQE